MLVEPRVNVYSNFINIGACYDEHDVRDERNCATTSELITPNFVVVPS
jgi:hypothetical protein